MSNGYTKARLQDWLDGDRQPGDRVIYEVNSLGHLHDRPTAAMVLAMEAERAGEVLLFQRRRAGGRGKARVIEYEARIPSDAAREVIAKLNSNRTAEVIADLCSPAGKSTKTDWLTEVPEKYEVAK